MKTTFENECGDLIFNDLAVGEIFTAPFNYPTDMVFMVLEESGAVCLSGGAAGAIYPIDDDETVKKLEGNLKVRFV